MILEVFVIHHSQFKVGSFFFCFEWLLLKLWYILKLYFLNKKKAEQLNLALNDIKIYLSEIKSILSATTQNISREIQIHELYEQSLNLFCAGISFTMYRKIIYIETLQHAINHLCKLME